VCFLLALGWALPGCTPDMSNTTAPPGDLAAYEPFGHLAEVAAFAGKNAKLVEIEARDVPSNGKLPLSTNLTARVEYQFITKDEKNRYESVHVVVMKPRVLDVSQDSTSRSEERHLGMGRDAVPLGRTALSGAVEKLVEKTTGVEFRAPDPKDKYERTPGTLPKCSAAALWTQAIAAGVPKGSTANITFDAKGYSLGQLRKPARRFGLDCKLISPDG
jgi:hypothetical protein